MTFCLLKEKGFCNKYQQDLFYIKKHYNASEMWGKHVASMFPSDNCTQNRDRMSYGSSVYGGNFSLSRYKNVSLFSKLL